MKFFYFGILISDIVNVSPCTEDGQTVIHLRNGSSSSLDGEWEFHVKKLEAILLKNYRYMRGEHGK